MSFQAAFDPRVKAAVCFFATDIHSATLGKGDDSLERVKKGALTGTDKAELVVSSSRSGPLSSPLNDVVLQMIFGKQDTHVPRAGRDLIRKTLEDADVACSVSLISAGRLSISQHPLNLPNSDNFSSSKYKHSMRSFGMSLAKVDGTQH
jgi:carboxymethylenebutenolidase